MRSARIGWAVAVAALCTLPSIPPKANADIGFCDGEARTAALRQDEARVLARLGNLTTLRGPADLAGLAALGYPVPPNMLTSFVNLGVTIARADSFIGQQVRSGNPAALFYRPNPQVPYVKDPYRPAFPYQLIGWEHDTAYTPAALPTSPDLCVSQLDWFVHEQGVHALPDWTFTPQPPPEHYRGASSGDPVPLPTSAFGPTTGRYWTIHVWRDPAGGPPTISVQRPYDYIPGVSIRPNATFFYPEHLTR
ncbi:hypothetical protein [Nocardia arthritidis]|uniref:Uncharacterized protein n=1 Tax=Nocardia arthritidis TaxID=228602 RepID=A0A6G9YSU3_9NOCA|nr:hypothetical protein [Nocardia arthritidis]QIS16177.1 hypothetical protein F5544_41835 [Nocardia arthritidis]